MADTIFKDYGKTKEMPRSWCTVNHTCPFPFSFIKCAIIVFKHLAEAVCCECGWHSWGGGLLKEEDVLTSINPGTLTQVVIFTISEIQGFTKEDYNWRGSPRVRYIPLTFEDNWG